MRKLPLLRKHCTERQAAVLMRRSVLQRVWGAAVDMVLAGDWMTYASVLMVSDIAFVAAPMNYWRHASGVGPEQDLDEQHRGTRDPTDPAYALRASRVIRTRTGLSRDVSQFCGPCDLQGEKAAA